MAEPELVEVPDRAAWRRWLSRRHRGDAGIWLVIHKKGSSAGSLVYEDAVLEALCFGWIDSKANALDAERYTLWMAPRKPRSTWSAVNKRRIESLLAEGLMTKAGLASIEAAEADGSWNALDRSDALEVPDDLVAEFRRHRGSRANWDGFPRASANRSWRGSTPPSARRPEGSAWRRRRASPRGTSAGTGGASRRPISPPRRRSARRRRESSRARSSPGTPRRLPRRAAPSDGGAGRRGSCPRSSA